MPRRDEALPGEDGESVSPAVCPLCGGANACAMAAAGGAAEGQPCWCVAASFDADLLARLPPAARDRACICAACAAASSARQ